MDVPILSTIPRRRRITAPARRTAAALNRPGGVVALACVLGCVACGAVTELGSRSADHDSGAEAGGTGGPGGGPRPVDADAAAGSDSSTTPTIDPELARRYLELYLVGQGQLAPADPSPPPDAPFEQWACWSCLANPSDCTPAGLGSFDPAYSCIYRNCLCTDDRDSSCNRRDYTDDLAACIEPCWDPERPEVPAIWALELSCKLDACAAVCSEVATTRSAIVGGAPAAQGPWGSVVRIGDCTGALLAPDVVVYAAHCGVDHREVTTRADDQPAPRPTQVAWCEAHAEAGVADSDIAVCLLESAVNGVTPIAPARGCERERVQAGDPVWLVGFGSTGSGGAMGDRRWVETTLSSLSPLLVAGTATAGVCHGDSGGPAFVQVLPGGASAEWRQLGVLSAGVVGQCGPGYYTDLDPFIPWIERTTQVDVTPCHDDAGNWAPTAGCVASRVEPGGPGGGETPSATCGAPYVESRVEFAPIDVEVADLQIDRARRTLTATVRATGGRPRVKRVSVALLSEPGEIVGRAVDEFPPYVLTARWEGAAPSAVRVGVTDYGGAEASTTVTVDGGVPAAGGGCVVARSSAPRGASWGPLIGLAALLLLAGRRGHPRR
ncbi:MAG: S1 family peptidase [Deltaproteobacteria bacterium]|nr:S1 family peptidase [Deltaproteobacteria bacterium]